MNKRSCFAWLVLLALSLSCGQIETPSAVLPIEDAPPTIPPTDYIPPTVVPTGYVPPAVTPSPTRYTPPTITATQYVPPAAPPTQGLSTSSQIDQKYLSLGGQGGFLGAATGPEQGTPDGSGLFRHFQGGSIYWNPSTGAWEVHGRIRDKWASLGWEQGFLGYPLTDESTTPDGIGRYNHFQGGSIYWSPSTDAWEVHGRIRDKWASLGWERSLLGYPVTDETTTPDGVGRFNHFQGGSIYWSPNTDAWEVHGDIRVRWSALGWEKSCLGYPIGDEEPGSGGWARQSRFEHGIIQWSPEKGAVETCY